jgi:hypothetical protein
MIQLSFGGQVFKFSVFQRINSFLFKPDNSMGKR